MTPQTPSSPASRLVLLAQRLVESLAAQVVALSGVRDALSDVLSALRAGDAETLVERAESLQEFIHVAAERKAAYGRQLDLFFRVAGSAGSTISDVLDQLREYPEAADVSRTLREARDTIRGIATESGRMVAASEYALGVTEQFNHELILLLHALVQPDGGRVYTARGETTAPKNRRSMIDRVG